MCGGHIAANYIAHLDLEPPFVCLCVSGGLLLIVDVKGYTDMAILGGTRDDAAGECFDKIARVMGLGYPGGGPLDRAAQGGNDGPFPLPRVHIEDAPLDMSFSGLKTAMLNLIHKAQQKGETLPVADLAASFSAAVSEELVPGPWPPPADGLPQGGGGGGVAANSRIRRDLEAACQQAGCTPVPAPPEALRGQWQHDWQPGLLRVPGRHPRGRTSTATPTGTSLCPTGGKGCKGVFPCSTGLWKTRWKVCITFCRIRGFPGIESKRNPCRTVFPLRIYKRYRKNSLTRCPFDATIINTPLPRWAQFPPVGIAGIAQSVEQLIRNQQVVSSSLISSSMATKKQLHRQLLFFYAHIVCHRPAEGYGFPPSATAAGPRTAAG